MRTGQGSIIAQDFDDALADLVVIERTGKTAVATTFKVVTRYPTAAGSYTYKTQKIGKNADGDVLYIRTIYEGTEKPAELLDAYLE